MNLYIDARNLFNNRTFNNAEIEMKYGYARVSTKAQDYLAQIEALKAAGCEKIFSEKQSGKSRDGRPEFAKLMKALLPGDTVVVTKLDRLARSSMDLQNIINELQGLSVGFQSLGETWCDTTSDVGMLVIQIMSGIAEFERKLIRSRTEAGIERAKKLGRHAGRKPILSDSEKRVIAELAGTKPLHEIAAEYEVSVGTIWNAIHGGHKRPFGPFEASVAS
jgi:DNA invertase Pin-like site-specific DNA recombinase